MYLFLLVSLKTQGQQEGKSLLSELGISVVEPLIIPKCFGFF